ncbi:hypothetical protein ACFSX5_12165 [Devosia albogilva]|uniref:Uncharacterized protein n=1 Tax=Devosia albogilva TaxID=429726 RepID=A0ABW5QLH1_9HYPH
MANLDTHDPTLVESARRLARRAGRIDHTQRMLVAAGLSAMGIVAVAATMLGMVL